MSLQLRGAAALAILLAACPLWAATAYVSNEGSGTVSIIDTTTDSVIATPRSARNPAASPSRGTAPGSIYPTRQPMRWLSSTPPNASCGDGPVGRLSRSHLSVARRQVAVRRHRGERPGRPRRPATLKVARRIAMKGKNPEHAVWSPDGKWLYVSAEEADSVDIVDVAKGDVVKSVKVGNRPRGIGFLPDGSRAYVAAENADTVNVFDTATHEVIARIKAGEPLERRPRASGRQARVRDFRRQRLRAGDRHVQQRDHRARFRSASVRGTWRSRPTARSSTSRAAARTPSRSSIRIPTRRSPRSPWANCLGAWLSDEMTARQ